MILKQIKAAALLLAVLLAAQVARSASTPLSKSDALYADVLPHFQAFLADLSEFEVLARKPMSQIYSVILVHAFVPDDKLVKLSTPETFKQEAFGLFVIDNASGRLYMPIDIFATQRWLDYEVIFDGVDERRVDIRRQGATYGDVADRVSYFLDIGSKKVLGAVTHHGMDISTMAVFQGALYFVGTGDLQTTILTKFNPPRPGSSAIDLSGFEVVDRIDGQRIQLIRTVSVMGDRLILTGENTRYVLAGSGWTVTGNPEATLFTYNPGSGRPVGVPFISFWVPLYLVQER